MTRYASLVLVILTSVTTLSLLSGCPASMSASSYTRDQARSAQDVQYGTVQSVRSVRIEGTKSGAGTLAGIHWIGGASAVGCVRSIERTVAHCRWRAAC